MATRGGAEDLDVCPECLGPFTDPTFLPCHHTVCAPCIQKIATRYSKRTFPCPACQNPTYLPRNGIRALQIITTLRTFVCSEDPNLKVFSLYHTKYLPPRGSLFVYVCFEPTGPSNKVLVRQFFDDGRFVKEWESEKGLVTMKYLFNDVRRIHHRIELEHDRGTFAKSTPFCLERVSPTKARLVNYWLPTGQFLVIRGTHTKNVNRHRAVDVDNAANVIFVVEEPRTPDGRRNVLMYRLGDENAVCVYTPPNAEDFQPADVCFFRLNGEGVLLVADEASEDIHVAKIGWTTLTFDRFLHTDCPELQYPTALAVDAQGRLWVACKGGLIVALHKVVKMTWKASAKPAKVLRPKLFKSSFHAPLCAIGFLLIAVFIGLVFYLSTPMK